MSASRAAAVIGTGELDWDFVERADASAVHGIHPYPARFIPDIPRRLIDLFHPGDSSAVLDPFCGSGTTLVEAQNYGVPSIGIDLHPLATLIAQVKTTHLPSPIMGIASEIAAKARMESQQIPAIPRLDHWFEAPVQQALANLTHGVRKVPDGRIRRALKVAISRIIVAVSNQESDTRYAAISKRVLTIDAVIERFLKSASLVNRACHEFAAGVELPPSTLLQRNVLEVRKQDLPQEIGLVVTSPPYPNAYEYWLYHKYRMYWLEMDPLAVRAQEIGARPHYFKKNHLTEHDFERQMEECFQLLRGVVRLGSYACFVVGRSIIHGREIDNAAILARAASQADFRLGHRFDRTIRKSRKSFAHGSIEKEAIMVFEAV